MNGRGVFAVMSAILFWTSAPQQTHAASNADAAGVEVSAVDVSDPPHVVLEFTVPAALTDGPLAGTGVMLEENGNVVSTQVDMVDAAAMEVVLAIDTSGSMNEGGAMAASIAAAQRFLDVLPAEVPVGIVAFADSPRLVSALSTDRAALASLVGGLTAGGETALHDALLLARSMFSGATADRQIVLLSDGGNTVGSATADDALQVATEVRTSVVALSSSEADPAILQQLADANHGTMTSVADPAALTGMYERIADSLVHRYRVTFDTTATGSATYVLTIDTVDGAVAATTSVQLPASVTTSSPTTAPTTSPGTVPGSVPASTAVPSTVAPGGTTASSTGWWLLGGAVAIFLSILVAVLTLRARRRDTPEADRLHARQAPRETGSSADSTGVGARLESLAERALGDGDRRRGLAMRLDVAAVRLRPGEFVVLSLIGAVVAALVLSTFLHLLGVVLGLVAVPVLVFWWVGVRADRRRRAFDDQLPDVLHLIVSLLRSGYGLPQTLDAVANQVGEPAATEFRRVLFEIRIGRDPTAALAATADRMRSRDFEWVVQAIHINREVGGELAAILEAVGETVRERQRLARQVNALTAEGRLSAILLTALPIFLVVMLSILSPGYFTPMKESPGPFLVVLAVVMLTVGWLWMRRIVKLRN